MIKKSLYILALAFLFCLGCQRNENSQVELLDEGIEVPDQEGWDSRITATKNGRKEADVEYGHMARFYRKKKVFFDEGVAVDFYDTAGRKRTRLTAQNGELNEATNDILALGQVVVVSDTGVTVYTEKLGYRQSTGKIYSDLDVTLITEKGDTLYGTGFESDTQLRFWEIKQPRGRTHARLDLSPEQLRKRPAVADDSLSTLADSTREAL